MNTQQVSFESIAQGAVAERANDAIKEILDNIFDPNTDPKAVRKVTVELKLKPSDDRRSAAYNICVKSALAPPQAVTGFLYIGRENGEPVCYENNPQQHSLNFEEDEK